jgi:hypothetical protein
VQLSYQVTDGNDDGVFAIAATGKITVADDSQLDFETIQSYMVTIQVSDGTHTADTQLTIGLNNLNDKPPVGDDAAFTI